MKAETRLTVRYAETDKMGIVHHSNYAVYFEAARTDFLRRAGLPYSEVEKRGVMMPLYGISTRFLAPAQYEDELSVVTWIKELGRVRLTLAYEVYRVQDGMLLATGETQQAFTDAALRPVDVKKAAPDLYALLKRCAGEGA
ncbi:MAG TPA: acyl-CoA thioesterase [Papillibacter sp.]|jgi:acyl-CoA thioester hydrolase|nr:acyl-CoA thioesterase [Papillibacter sp.]